MNNTISDIRDILREAYHNEHILKIENQVLKEEIETLQTENASLKESLRRYEKPQLDSHNSSVPPSVESLKAQAIRRPRSLRTPSDKKSGGQVGHKGVTLVRSEKADEVQPIARATVSNAVTHCWIERVLHTKPGKA